METQYENKYGRVTLTTITPFMPVGKIHGKDYSDDIKINLEDAEKVALITENRRIQLCFENSNKVYVALHDSASTAAVCEVKINFTSNVVPCEEIDRLKQPLFLGYIKPNYNWS